MARHADGGFVEDRRPVGTSLAGDDQVRAFKMSIEVQHLTDHVDARLNLGPGKGDQPRAQTTSRPGPGDVHHVVPRVPLDHPGEVSERGVQLGDHLFRRSLLRAEYLRRAGRPTQGVGHVGGGYHLDPGDTFQQP